MGLAVSGELAQDRDVAGEERVALAERAHRDVLGRPLADAGKTAQPLDGAIKVAARVEEALVIDGRAGHALKRRRPGRGHAETGKLRRVEMLRRWERVRKPRDLRSIRDLHAD